jgi:hypothetical protein
MRTIVRWRADHVQPVHPVHPGPCTLCTLAPCTYTGCTLTLAPAASTLAPCTCTLYLHPVHLHPVQFAHGKGSRKLSKGSQRKGVGLGPCNFDFVQGGPANTVKFF